MVPICLLYSGTNVTFTVDFGDNTPLLTRETSNSGSALHNVHHNYSNTGKYAVSVSASNLVNPKGKKIKLVVFVEEPVVGLNLTVDLPHKVKSNAEQAFIAVGESVIAHARTARGTDVTFQFRFGETAVNISETSLAHAYQSPGRYVVRVDAFNHINAMSAAFDLPIIVQTDSLIYGLSIQHGVTALGNSTSFVLSMDQGSAFLCDWSFGDGHSTESDFSDLKTPILHTYDSVNAYNVSITCTNRHGAVLLTALAWVQIPITGVEITSSYILVTTDAEVPYNISVGSGSHVSYEIYFEGNNNATKMILPEIIAKDRVDMVSHNFTKPGTFVAHVVAINYLGSVRAVCNSSLVVQSPIQGLQLTVGSPIKLSDGSVSYKLAIPMGISEATNATCHWAFGDGSNLTKAFYVDQRHQQITDHAFSKAGEYRTSVTCQNFVSAVTLNTSVIVHDLVQPVITVKSKQSSNSSLTCFVVGEVIIVGVTSQAFDSFYFWDLGDGNTTYSTQEPRMEHSFTSPGVYTVRVRVNNDLEQMHVSHDVTVQSRITGVNFTAGGVTMLRTPTHFLIEVSVLGTDACYVIDFGEASRDVIFGGQSCSAGLDAHRSIFVQNEDTTMSYDYLYSSEGNFSATLHAYNKVSDVRKSVVVEVRKPVCEINDVMLRDEAGGDIPVTPTFSRSDKITFWGKFGFNCPLAEGVQIRWKVNKVTSNGEQTIGSPQSTRLDEFTSAVVLAPRTLTYGTFRITCRVGLTGTDVASLYGSLSKESNVMIKIIPTALLAVIKGGQTIQVGKETNLVLDGSLSRDPDVERDVADSNMNFAWYCRTTEEPQHGATESYVGCYKDQNDPQMLLSSKAIFNTNTDDFSENKTYIYKLQVSKDNRKSSTNQIVLVIAGAPPKMGIR